MNSSIGSSCALGPTSADRLSSSDHADHEAPAQLKSSVAARARSKRLFDVVASAALLVALSPLLLVVSLLVRLESPGPVFFRSRRVGFGGRPLGMLKFRKMHRDAQGIGLTTSADERLTRVGTWLAALKLDEFPQLWHVLRGEMSIVGPRPEDPTFAARHPVDYAEILSVRPGILGLSQIAFAQEARILDVTDPVGHYVDRILPQKVELDLLYVRRWSFWLDVRVISWGVVTVLLRRAVAVDRAGGRMNLRKRRVMEDGTFA